MATVGVMVTVTAMFGAMFGVMAMVSDTAMFGVMAMVTVTANFRKRGGRMPLNPQDKRRSIDAYIKRNASADRLSHSLCAMARAAIVSGDSDSVRHFVRVSKRKQPYANALRQVLAAVPNEEQSHKIVARWLDQNPLTRGRWFHPANGEHRSKITGARLKSMGVRPGVPDFMILTDRGVCAVELKRLDGGRVSDAQKHWIDVVNSSGGFACVAYGHVEAISAIEGFLNDRGRR